MKIRLIILVIFITFQFVSSVSVVSSDPLFSTENVCDGRTSIQEWIKQRKEIPLNSKNNVLQVIISTSFTDDLKRAVNSAEIYEQAYVIVGLCEEWNGENQLHQFLASAKENKKIDFEKMLILYTSTNNLMVNSPQKLSEFYSENYPDGTILFKAERFCYPRNLESKIKSSQRFKFPNSQAFLSPANQLLSLMNEFVFDGSSERSIEVFFQNYFVNAFINLKDKFKMQVDSGRKVFASLYGKDDQDTYQIKTRNGVNSLIWRSFDPVTNEISDSTPILLGDLPVSFLDFVSKPDDSQKDQSWTKNLQRETKASEREVRSEIDAKFEIGLLQNFFPSSEKFSAPFAHPSVPKIEVKETNKVMISLFFSDNDIFVRLILEAIEELEYPKENIGIFINYKKTAKKANADIENWIEKVEKLQGTPGNYFLLIKSNEKDISKVKREALLATVEHKCDFYFTTDAILENKKMISHLIEQKKRFISPLVTLPQSTFSNFWGKINWEKQGYQKHSLYPSIVSKEYSGVLRVPIVWGTFMIHSSLIPQIADNYQNSDSSNINWDSVLDKMEIVKKDDDWWHDIIFSIKCSFTMDDGIWLDNKEHFGSLIDKDEVTPEENDKFDNENGKLHRELYAYPNNKLLFKKYYYSQNFYDFIVNDVTFNFSEPCIDAFAWEYMRPIFGEHLIEEAENYGKWSGGGHNSQYDPRIGGTESYPTQDIHMNQMGLHEIWLNIINTDVARAADTFYGGVQTKGYNIAFIVRYKPGHQSSLKPHHDSALYTISVALNKPGRDFQGGGVRYVRRNCTYINPEAGYSVIHPGRVTHKHEGLETTGGTRYIFVTFVV